MMFPNNLKPHDSRQADRLGRSLRVMAHVMLTLALASVFAFSVAATEADAIPTPEPTPIPSPTLEPTPLPSPTPEPTPTSEPPPLPSPMPTSTPTPDPTPTFEPTPTLDPTPTLEPTPEPTPTTEATPTLDLLAQCEELISLVPTVSAQAIDFGTLVWSGTGYPTVQRQLTINIQGPDDPCVTMADGWNIQISSSGMVDPGGFTIAPSAIVYVGPSSSLPAGVTPVSGRRPLSQSGTLIATGSSAAVESSGWTITLEFTPPSDTPPGSYSAAINIEVVSAGA